MPLDTCEGTAADWQIDEVIHELQDLSRPYVILSHGQAHIALCALEQLDPDADTEEKTPLWQMRADLQKAHKYGDTKQLSLLIAEISEYIGN